MYIAISGNIGSGKTTLTEILAKRCGAQVYEEDCNNPYLNDFYNDMSRWAFNLQIYFLASRIEQMVEMLNKGDDYIIQDRTIYEDAHIFAENLHEMGLISSRDFSSYMKLFDISSHMIQRPDLLVYLKSDVPTLIRQIKKRGREYEMAIDEAYLQRLNDKYNNWIENIYKGEVYVIEIDSDDFVVNPEVLEPLILKIEELKSKI